MLTLRYLDVSPLLPRPLRIFSTQEKALSHVRDHVLTPPESYAWSLVVPEFRSVFNAEDRREVNRLARQFEANPLPPEAQLLYDGYTDAIGQAIREAIVSERYWQEQAPDGSVTWHGMGKSGIYAIWDRNVIRTGFLSPGDDEGAKRRRDSERRQRGPLPRKRHPRENATKLEPVGIPEDTPAARFDVFKKCWDYVRLAFEGACRQQRRVPGIGRMDHWRNKPISFQEWLAL